MEMKNGRSGYPLTEDLFLGKLKSKEKMESIVDV